MNIWVYLLSISLSVKVGFYLTGIIWLAIPLIMFANGQGKTSYRWLLFFVGLTFFTLAGTIPSGQNLKEAKHDYEVLCMEE